MKERFSISINEELKRFIDEQAKKENRSVSNMIEFLLLKGIEALHLDVDSEK